jgi:hypothetical protein
MDALTTKERELIEPKLDCVKGESYKEAFARLVQGKDLQETGVNTQSLINFVDAMGKNARGWAQVSNITRIDFQGANPNTKQIQSSVIAFKVRDKDEFLNALRVTGYHVNTLSEKTRIRVGTVRRNLRAFIKAALTRTVPEITRLPSHRFDNARQPTRRIFDPQLHIYNETGDNNFQAHWDLGSSNTGRRVIDPIGGVWHGYFAPPEEVAKHLTRIH